MLVEFVQTIALDAVNNLIIYGIIDAVSGQIGADLYFMLIILCCAVCQMNIRQVRKIGICVKFFFAVIVD